MVLSLEEAKNKRKLVKITAKRYRDQLEALNGNSVSTAELESRRDKFLKLWDSFNDIQDRIEGMLLEDVESPEVEEDLVGAFNTERNAFENDYHTCIAQINRAIELVRGRNDRNTPATARNTPTTGLAENKIKLPPMQVPTFAGSFDTWRNFRDSFRSLIHDNQSLTKIQKFHHLHSALSGPAAGVISSYEICEDNYEEAWNHLNERYSNEKWMIEGYVNALINLPVIKKETPEALRQLHDSVSKNLRALKVLKRPSEHWGDIMVQIMLSKLDANSFQIWELTRTSEAFPSLGELMSFLLKQANSLETVRKQFGPSKSDNMSKPSNVKVAKSYATSIKSSCPKCKGPHMAFECSEFRRLLASERLPLIQHARLCTNCLRTSKHNARNCSSSRCRKCGKAHHTLLHLEPQTTNTSNPTPNGNQSGGHSLALVGCLIHPSTVLLSTALVQVQRLDGSWTNCVALLDSGSQPNFITTTLAADLKIPLNPTNISIKGISQDTVAARKCAVVRFKSRLNSFNHSFDCLVVNQFTDRTPQAPLPRRELNIPKNIQLANPDFHSPRDIDMLIGADTYYKLLCVGQIRPADTDLIYQKTHLGWVVAGRPYPVGDANIPQSLRCHVCSIERLEEGLSRFWEIDTVLDHSNPCKEAIECENFFQKTTTRNASGRFIVRLPFKEDVLQQLGSSRDIAKKRFLAIEKKLHRDLNFKVNYIEFMREYEKLGHMQEVDASSIDIKPAYYIPHHAVIKPTSTTTKVRVVFDASCKTDTNVALNDALKVGPALQDDLFSTLLRFRSFRVALIADVAKMYRQILVDARDTSFQRIFWREDPNLPLKTYELKTVTYGTASASYLAIKTLRHLAEIESSRYPIGSKVILRDFYVDDLLTGADTVQEALIIRDQTTAILRKGGFELRKWASSSQESLLGYDSDEETYLFQDFAQEIRTLGINWLKRVDRFSFTVMPNQDSNTRVTKRSILSRISTIFDPLGLLGPVVLLAKVILQRLWQLKINWDESLPADIHTKWVNLEGELPALAELTIPRRLSPLDEINRFEIHAFCDASEIAYGACIYVLSQDASGRRVSSLACAKSRVAPLKALSIPRLELCGALLLSRLVTKVINSLHIQLHSVSFYTDSTIVLHWLASSSRTLTTFVANRVGEIQQATEMKQWYHVPTDQNPADCLSRGLFPRELANFELWWHGPVWLCDQEQLPQPFCPNSQFQAPEQRVHCNLVGVPTSIIDLMCHRISSWSRLIRVTAYMLRFIAKIRKGPEQRPVQNWLSNSELDRSMELIVKNIQGSAFSQEIKSLQSDGEFISKSPLRFLNPFLDEVGVLRVGGRLKHSGLPYSAKHQILLPAKHPFTTMLIEYEHKRNLHAGSQATLAFIRQRFWPLSARNAIRKTLRQCITCFRVHPHRTQPRMGDLPAHRVQPTRPFAVTGVDFCGPFSMIEGVRRSARTLKTYVAVFICFATKAIHLELVLDMTTEAFLNSFKRFIARRGRPAEIYSDNGLNFVGAHRELKRLFENEAKAPNSAIVKFANQELINWHFSPPRAPHFGGLWEAAVKSFKYLFKRIAGDVRYRQDELTTLIAGIEAVLNSRPISACSEDPGDTSYLTPGHFLIGTAINSYPERNFINVPLNRLSRWEKVEQCRQHFWKRWQREFLNQAQQRYKWHKPSESLYTVGRLVVIAEDNLPPLSWALGRIIETFPGADGIVRTVNVLTNDTTYKRPVTKLYPLPVE